MNGTIIRYKSKYFVFVDGRFERLSLKNLKHVL